MAEHPTDAPSFWLGVSDGRRDFEESRGALDDILRTPRHRWSDWERGYVYAAAERGMPLQPVASAANGGTNGQAWEPAVLWNRFDAPLRMEIEARPPKKRYAADPRVRALLVLPARTPRPL